MGTRLAKLFGKRFLYIPLPVFLAATIATFFISFAVFSLYGANALQAFMLAGFSSVIGVGLVGFLFTTVNYFIEGRGLLELIDTGEEPPPQRPRGPVGSSRESETDEQFDKRMRKLRIKALKRDTRNTRARVIRNYLTILLLFFGTWFIMDDIALFFHKLFLLEGGGALSSSMGIGDLGSTFKDPKSLFIFDWRVLAVIWFFIVLWLPSGLAYLIFMGAFSMRLVFMVFGQQGIIFVLNYSMLPGFYLLMMVFMFGSILLPFLTSFKFYKPGDATWQTREGAMRGQPHVRAGAETQIRKFIKFVNSEPGDNARKPTRGILFAGPPGTGKTLYAKELATRLELPFAFADGQAFQFPFPGLDRLMMRYVEWRVNSFAKAYKGIIFFIDECELVFAARAGLSAGGRQTSMGSTEQYPASIWDVLSYDSAGAISSCGLVLDSPEVRARIWDLKPAWATGRQEQPTSGILNTIHRFFMPMGMGGGAGGGAILYFLTWMDGTGSPPIATVLKRRFVNTFLHFFLPVTIPFRESDIHLRVPFAPSRLRIPVPLTKQAVSIPLSVSFAPILRMPPASPEYYNILFIGATNRPEMLDPAILRPGRMGITLRFDTPGVEDRKDIIKLYFDRAKKKGWMLPEVNSEENIETFARATSNMSPAEIEATIDAGPDVREYHVENLKRLHEMLESKIPLEDFIDEDRKYWLRHEDETKKAGWDDTRADMLSLLEARNTILWGRSDAGRTTELHREHTADHELYGHLIELFASLGDFMRPTVISVLPRGKALGMVAHVPVEERDPQPQRILEGMIRISVGSTVAENFIYGEHTPGVSSDLANATRIACFMVGRTAMPPYNCAEDESERYKKYGEILIQVPEAPTMPTMPNPNGFIQSVLMDPKKAERVAIIMGQAYVDCYRLIKLNYGRPYLENVKKDLLRLDELGGSRLEKIWQDFKTEIKDWSALTEEQKKTWWPDKIFASGNPFYEKQTPEAREVA